MDPVLQPAATEIIRTAGFEGPLDLLLHLIERNRIDIYDIPIAEIADQYLAYLQGMLSLDLEIASEFLVMASTLLHMKSRLLLPSRDATELEPGVDPREELVIRLLEYRRCRALADELRAAHEIHELRVSRLPELPIQLGLDPVKLDEPLNRDAFFDACEALNVRNRARFQNLSVRMTHILQREKVSLRDKVRLIWQRLIKQAKVLFHEIFPDRGSTRAERVTGFLALLELLKLNKIRVTQEHPFDVMMIQPAQESPQLEDEDLKRFLADRQNDRVDYR